MLVTFEIFTDYVYGNVRSSTEVHNSSIY